VTDEPLRTGVIGVGSMGRNHARVYRELAGADLVGVADADTAAAAAAATEFDTSIRDTPDLLDAVDAVSVAVPTRAHAPVVQDCIDAGVDVLVEKPFVADPDVGRELARAAAAAGVTIQVGHVERFNPAVRTLFSAFQNLSVVAVTAERLGPPVERDIEANVVFDLMIHDIDLLCTLLEGRPELVSAAGAGSEYATATWSSDGVVASLTASRITQERVRRLTVTAEECRVVVDLLDQTVEVHRRSRPEYVASDGDVRHRIESVVERPFVESGEPLKQELAAFVDAAANGTEPLVTAADGVRAVELAGRVSAIVEERETTEVSP
jgi:predicted dehydrogenase